MTKEPDRINRREFLATTGVLAGTSVIVQRPSDTNTEIRPATSSLPFSQTTTGKAVHLGYGKVVLSWPVLIGNRCFRAFVLEALIFQKLTSTMRKDENMAGGT